MREALVRPSWAHAVLAALVFAALPVFTVRHAIVCSSFGDCPPWIEDRVALLALLRADAPEPVPTIGPVVGGLVALAVAVALVAAWRHPRRARLAAALRPTRRRALLGAWAALPVASYLMHAWNGRAGGLVHLSDAERAAYAASELLFVAALPVAWIERGAAALLVGAAQAWAHAAGVRGFDFGRGMGTLPEHLSPAGVAVGVVAHLAVAWLLACGLDAAWARRGRGAAAAPPAAPAAAPGGPYAVEEPHR